MTSENSVSENIFRERALLQRWDAMLTSRRQIMLQLPLTAYTESESNDTTQGNAATVDSFREALLQIDEKLDRLSESIFSLDPTNVAAAERVLVHSWYQGKYERTIAAAECILKHLEESPQDARSREALIYRNRAQMELGLKKRIDPYPEINDLWIGQLRQDYFWERPRE